LWEHASYERQSRTFTPVCLHKAKSDFRDDHTENVDKTARKLIIFSKSMTNKNADEEKGYASR